MSPLLQNAVVSIQLGLEDYASDDERRVISAVRNLYSGVLLLCKEVLRQLSPPDSNDILIRKNKKADKDPDGNVRFIGAGKKTVDRFEIEENIQSASTGRRFIEFETPTRSRLTVIALGFPGLKSRLFMTSGTDDGPEMLTTGPSLGHHQRDISGECPVQC